MKNFNKTFQIAANLLKEIQEIDSPLINIFCHDDRPTITFWEKDMVDYFDIDICSESGKISFDTNCDYKFNNWPPELLNGDYSRFIEDLVDEFYKY